MEHNNEQLMEDIFPHIQEYNDYLTRIYSTIFPFDLWYEHTKGIPIPEDWKLVVVKNANHT